MEIKKFAELLSTSDLKKLVTIDKNVDDNLLVPSIIHAQDIDLQQVIGTNLYNKIMAEVYDQTLSGSYQALLYDYIVPYLAEATLYYTYTTLNYRLTNKAVSEKNSADSQPSDLSTIKFLMQESKNRKEYRAERIKAAICINRDSFPEYFNNVVDVKPSKDNYDNGFYLGPDYGEYWGCGCKGECRCN